MPFFSFSVSSELPQCHSFCSLSYDKSIVSYRVSSTQSVTQCFLFQFPVSFLFLKVIQQLLLSCTLSSHHFYHSLYLSFNKVFQKTSSPSSSITFHNFLGISDLLPEVSQFQHHTKLWSKCSTLLVSSLNFSPICC